MRLLTISTLLAAAALAQPAPELVVTTGHHGAVTQLVFTDNQTLVSSGADGTQRSWEAATGQLLRKTYVPPPPFTSNPRATSPDAKLTATGDIEGAIRIFAGPPTGQPRLTIPANTTTVGNLMFTPSGALRVFGAAANSGRIWDVGPIEQATVLPAGYLSVRSVTASPDGNFLAAFSPLQISWWDLLPVPVAHQAPAASIDAWPIACLADGRCAWEEAGPEGKLLTVRNLRTNAPPQQLPLGFLSTVALAFTPNGSQLAAATTEPHVLVINAAGASRTLALQTGAPTAGQYLQRLSGRKLILPNPDMPTAVAFSPDGKLLAAANAHAIYLWDAATLAPRTPYPAAAAVTALAFSAQGKLAAALDTGELRIFDLSGRAPEIHLTGSPALSDLLVFRDDSNLLAASGDDGIDLWDLRQRTPLAHVAFTNGGGWIATAPDGSFDASDRAWEQASWRIGGPTGSLVPIGTYARDYFSPGLIADLLSGRPQPPRKQLASLDRSLPRVTLTSLGAYNPASGLARVHAEVDPAGAKAATDLALYRNGRLIRALPGKASSADFDLPMPPGPNQLTAAVFNSDGLRSQSAVLPLPDPRSMYQSPITTLYVLAIGINQYADPALNLNFARADAESIADSLALPVGPLPISLGGPRSATPSKVARHKLLDREATREGILASIRQIVAFAVPGDSFIFYYAGHSVAQTGNFYLLPHDAKLGLPATYLSDADLNAALAPLDASHIALIFDSCNSGKIVDARDRRGPLAGRGLARLTYDKGMWVLTASQTAQEAKEDTGLKHGLLTYALVEEGLKASKADPGSTGKIDLGAWLRYAADRVPSLDREVRQKGRGISTKASPRQVPQFVPDPDARELLILKTGGPAK